jgi:hypothetical protein
MEKYFLLLFLTNKICLASLNHYVKMPKTDVVSHDLAYFECGEGIEIIFISFLNFNLLFNKVMKKNVI